MTPHRDYVTAECFEEHLVQVEQLVAASEQQELPQLLREHFPDELTRTYVWLHLLTKLENEATRLEAEVEANRERLAKKQLGLRE
jgi:hypothetical protein